MRWLSVVKPVLHLVYFAAARDTDFPDCDWAPKRPRRRRRVMLSTSAARLSHASISNICSGRQRWTQSATVAISPVTVRLITMGIAASDQRAIRGQLATIARPGTKKMNPSASTVRPGPTRFTNITAISDAAMIAASTSSTSAHCATGRMTRGYRVNIPQVWTSTRFAVSGLAGSGVCDCRVLRALPTDSLRNRGRHCQQNC